MSRSVRADLATAAPAITAATLYSSGSEAADFTSSVDLDDAFQALVIAEAAVQPIAQSLPEPATLLMVGLGLVALAIVGRRISSSTKVPQKDKGREEDAEAER